jgi:hypothetical protein
MNSRMLKSSLSSLLLLISLLLTGIVAEAGAAVKGGNRHREFNVMTRNLYLGTDFDDIFAAQTFEELVVKVGEAYTEVGAGLPAERIAGIADEIEAGNPVLVGLQEVALWRVGAPFDPAPAEVVTYDFLQLLLDELAARGLHYAPVAVKNNFEAEVPAVFSPTAALDVRYTDRLVVLARSDLRVSQFKLGGVQAEHFTTNLTFMTPTLGTITIPRAWIAVDVKMRGKTYRFVNTHLESFSPIVNYLQAGELVKTLGETDLPLIVTGDFNADGVTQDASYQLLLSSGATDVWSQLRPAETGATWPLFLVAPSIYTPPTQRLDLVLVRGALDALEIDRVGEDPAADRTPSGLMRSDHAGVTARVRLQP